MIIPRGREVEAFIDAIVSLIDEGMLVLVRKYLDGWDEVLGAF